MTDETKNRLLNIIEKNSKINTFHLSCGEIKMIELNVIREIIEAFGPDAEFKTLSFERYKAGEQMILPLASDNSKTVGDYSHVYIIDNKVYCRDWNVGEDYLVELTVSPEFIKLNPLFFIRD